MSVATSKPQTLTKLELAKVELFIIEYFRGHSSHSWSFFRSGHLVKVISHIISWSFEPFVVVFLKFVVVI